MGRQRFGTRPAQVFFSWNTASHVQDNEQNPKKRPFSKQELQQFFDHADDEVTLIANSRKKGWLPAYQDSVMFKVAYSYGLRFNELRHLQTVDFSRNPHAREFGRYGKSSTLATITARSVPSVSDSKAATTFSGYRNRQRAGRDRPLGSHEIPPLIYPNTFCQNLVRPR